MKILVLGSGCATCKKLHQSVLAVVKNDNIDAEVEYSTDAVRMVELGLMHGPVLAIDGVPIEFKSISEKDIRDAIMNQIVKDANKKSCPCGGKC